MMRYYEKDRPGPRQGPQATGFWRRARLRARAILFGRVSREMVLWLGAALIVLALALALLGLSNLSGGRYQPVHDPAAQMMIRR